MTSSAADGLRRDAHLVIEIPAELVDVAAQRYKAAIGQRLTSDTGGDRLLSGMVRRRRRSAIPALSVDVVPMSERAGGAGAWVFAGPKRLRGPWSWLEAGTSPHRIKRWVHPGARPLHTFSNPADTVTPQVLAEVDATFLNMPLGE